MICKWKNCEHQLNLADKQGLWAEGHNEEEIRSIPLPDTLGKVYTIMRSPSNNLL